jgi:hypothetical protein
VLRVFFFKKWREKSTNNNASPMDLLVGAEAIAFPVSGGLSRLKRTSGPLFFRPGGLKSLFEKVRT